jgi:hypothetical protein
MTTITAPLTSLTLAAPVPDVVRSCVVLQPSPPPDPGEEPPAPVTGPGIYTPIAPGVTYASLPVAPTIVDTSPDQMIGCIITVADNPQGRLDALFPSAVNGDGIIDRATNDIWVYDGTTWNNFGPTPGPTIVATTVIPPWNEIVLATALTRTKLSVNALAYALELLTEPDPLTTRNVLSVRSIGAYIVVDATDLTLSAETPGVSVSALVPVPNAALTLQAEMPAVSTGASIALPAATAELIAVSPTVTITNPQLLVSIPTASIALSAIAPAISTGTSIATPSVNITTSTSVPEIQNQPSQPSVDYWSSWAEQNYGWWPESYPSWWAN